MSSQDVARGASVDNMGCGAHPFCDECGRLLYSPSAERLGQARQTSRLWHWLLVIVGAFLIVSFGARARHAYDVVAAQGALLRDIPGFGATAAPGPADNPSVAVAHQTSSEILRIYLPYRAQLERDIAVALAGFVITGAGVRALVRPRPRGTSAQSAGPSGEVVGATGRQTLVTRGINPWTAGEGMILALVRPALLIVGAVGIARLRGGESLTWQLPAETVSQTIDLIITTARLVGGA